MATKKTGQKARRKQWQQPSVTAVKTCLGSTLTLPEIPLPIKVVVPNRSIDPTINPAEGILKGRYPHGHPRFTELAVQEVKLHSEKNHDYAAGGDPLGNFDRVAKILENYPGLDVTTREGVALHWMLKQLDAYMWMKAKKIKAKAEGLGQRLGDVSVYAKIIRIMEES